MSEPKEIRSLIKTLHEWADGDVREIGADLVKGTTPPDIRDFEKWAALMDQGASALSVLQEENKRLTLENWQLKQALGYPIPSEFDTPQNPFRCGSCDARAALKETTIGDLRRAKAATSSSTAR